MKMKQKHGKLLRGLTGIAVALLCFAATVALTGGRAEAKSQDVMTGKGGWDKRFGAFLFPQPCSSTAQGTF